MGDKPAVLAAFAHRVAAPLGVVLLAAACSSTADPGDGDTCFPDADGVTGGSYSIELTVDDTEFSKSVLNTQNNSTVTLTLTNAGTVPHGFELGCVDVTSEYPNLPAGCPRTTCFPAEATLEPIMPGESQSVSFVTPPTDNLIYPFASSAPDDANVLGLNDGQWSLM